MNYIEVMVKKLQARRNVFLSGGAGVGKTTATKEIISIYEGEGKSVAKLASSAMAATLIGGQSIHSFFDFRLFGSVHELELGGKFALPKKVKKILTKVDLLIIDEISMVSSDLLEMIALRLVQAEFKGSLLVVGDFLQLPPVVKGGGSVEFAFECEAWREFAFDVVVLEQNHRSSDTYFIDALEKIRRCRVDGELLEYLEAFVSSEVCDENVTMLYGKNASANSHNERLLNAIDGEMIELEAELEKLESSVSDAEAERFFDEARVERVLRLKVGAKVLFTRNAWNYYNGERGEVVRFDDEAIYVRKSGGEVIKVEQVETTKSLWGEEVVDGESEAFEKRLLLLRHYPLRVAYAITIHKSQGMSLADLMVCTNEIFAPSQFYVAISRAIDPQKLKLTKPKRGFERIIYAHKKALEYYG